MHLEEGRDGRGDRCGEHPQLGFSVDRDAQVGEVGLEVTVALTAQVVHGHLEAAAQESLVADPRPDRGVDRGSSPMTATTSSGT
jgi:hypothetical protein